MLDQTTNFDPVRLLDRQPIVDAERFPPGRQPYYINAPHYIRTSAGIKSLHILCHCLNRAGYEAYMAIYPNRTGQDDTSPDLLTPELTPNVVQEHRRRGVSPIMVYPENIKGNPFGAHTVVRYVMNFPGLLGGDRRYRKSEIIFSYSRVLAEAAGAPDSVLFLPPSDATVFTPGDNQERSGSCFWAAKYQMVHNGELLPVTANSVEITRDKPHSQTVPEIVELLRRSEVFYTYENTSMALEAALCLCPTVFLPNPWLTEAIGANELGWDGYAWGTDPQELARAKATVHLARSRYLATYGQFWEDLSGFVRITQQAAEKDAATRNFPAWLNLKFCVMNVVGSKLFRAVHLVKLTWMFLWRIGPIGTLLRIKRWIEKRVTA